MKEIAFAEWSDAAQLTDKGLNVKSLDHAIGFSDVNFALRFKLGAVPPGFPALALPIASLADAKLASIDFFQDPTDLAWCVDVVTADGRASGGRLVVLQMY